MNGLIAHRSGVLVDPEDIRAELAAITDPAEIGEGINRLDAWIAALREIDIDGSTEKVSAAIFEAIERRISAVNFYDGLDNESGKRTDLTSGNGFPEVSVRQKALTEIGVTGRAIRYWRTARDYIPGDEREQIYRDHRLDEKFGISVYLDLAKGRHKEKQRKEKQTLRLVEILDAYDRH